MAQLVLHFGWTWVGTIAADDDYGKYGIKDFKEQVEEAGVCISFSETLPKVINCSFWSIFHCPTCYFDHIDTPSFQNLYPLNKL